MKNFFAIVLIIVVIYMFTLPISIISTKSKDDSELESLLLSTAVDYAGEAAMLACIDREHLSTDYSTNDILFTPDYVADAFASSLCISYGLSPTEENISRIMGCIPVIVLATNNGYFIAEWKQKDDNSSELIWEPKKPYVIDSNPDSSNTGKLYCVQLNREAATIIEKSNLSVTETADYSSVPYTAEQIYQYANRTINNDVNAVLARYIKSFNRSEISSFYLPVAANSHSGVNRVESPTLIIVVRGLSINGSIPIDTSVVSGIRIDDKTYIVGWTSDDGTKYYAKYSSSAGQSAFIKNSGVIFSSEAAAAKAGYVPYFD